MRNPLPEQARRQDAGLNDCFLPNHVRTEPEVI